MKKSDEKIIEFIERVSEGALVDAVDVLGEAVVARDEERHEAIASLVEESI
jgi:hypothetical protein